MNQDFRTSRLSVGLSGTFRSGVHTLSVVLQRWSVCLCEVRWRRKRLFKHGKPSWEHEQFRMHQTSWISCQSTTFTSPDRTGERASDGIRRDVVDRKESCFNQGIGVGSLVSERRWILGSEHRDGFWGEDVLSHQACVFLHGSRSHTVCSVSLSWTTSCIAPLMIGSSMIGWTWGWRSVELDGTMGSHDAAEWFLETIDWWVSVNSTSALSLSWQTACLRVCRSMGLRSKVGQSSSDCWKVHPRNLVTASRMSRTRMDTHDVRNARLLQISIVVEWRIFLTARSRVRDQVYVTCCCEFFVRLGSCPLVWHMYGVYLLALTRCIFKPFGWRVRFSICVKSGETDYLLFFMKSSCIRCLESGLSKSAIVISRTSVNKFARLITKWTKACDKRLSRLISYIHHTCDVENNADWNCFKVPILQEILRIQILHQVEHCAFLEVTCLFQ